MGRFLKVIGMIGALGACAQSPESIAPTYVSTAQYQVMTCPQLEREMARLNERVAVLSDQQRRKRVGDVVENIFSFHPSRLRKQPIFGRNWLFTRANSRPCETCSRTNAPGLVQLASASRSGVESGRPGSGKGGNGEERPKPPQDGANPEGGHAPPCL